MESTTKLAEAIQRLRRIRECKETSQDIYGVLVTKTNIHDAARRVKRMMLDDERLVINYVLDIYPLVNHKRPLVPHCDVCDCFGEGACALEHNPEDI